MPILAQTLHGYDQGHRLLASGGDLDARELSLLDRLSDLSGYLPTGTRFDRYHTGFPCGRYYALACTWTDLAATRAGTVLTHTVLLPRGEAGALEDLWGLTLLHRRPRSASDRDAYREVLSLPVLPVAPPEPLGLEQRTAAAVLLLGSPDRPILWVDEHPPDAVVRFLWSLLRPDTRPSFAFCTFALQPRSVEGQVFTFLGLPPAARGSFLDRAGSEAWWDSGQLLHPRMVALTQQPWAGEVAREGTAPLRRLEEFCDTQGLRRPLSKDYTTFWRFMGLEAAASERLAAARARVDLFVRLWPEVKASHPFVAPLLQTLLERQGDAALEPRPLWELTDFLQRPLVRERRGLNAGFESEVMRVLTRELDRRFSQAFERTARELPELLTVLGGREDAAQLDTLRGVLTAHPEASMRLVPSVLRAAVVLHWSELVHTALAVLSPENRRQAIDLSRRGLEASDQEALLLLAQEAAEGMGDLSLYLFLGRERGHELEALRSVTRRLLEQGHGARELLLPPLLSNVSASVRLEWALETSTPDALSQFAAQEGVRAARALELKPEALVESCAGPPNGARVLLLFAKDSSATHSALAEALRHAPELALGLVTLALSEGGSRAENLARVAAGLVPTDQLLAPALRQALLSTDERSRVRDLVARLGPQWARALCEDSMPLAEAVEWLALPSLRQWLETASRASLLAATGRVDEEQLLPRIATVLATWLDVGRGNDTYWIRPLLTHLLSSGVSAQAFDTACPPLARILRRVTNLLHDDGLTGDLLARVARIRGDSGWCIVELVFPRYYERACREEKSWVNAFAALFSGQDWDKAKPLRRWLLDIYLACQWPPESFLRALAGDTSLFFRLAHRAAKSEEGMHFLRRLPAALEADPSLAPGWRRPIEEVLANPQRAVDFE